MRKRNIEASKKMADCREAVYGLNAINVCVRENNLNVAVKAISSNLLK